MGEVWANMLHNVYAALVGEYGWEASFRTSADSEAGNVVFMHLFIDALALQPCNPTREYPCLVVMRHLSDVVGSADCARCVDPGG